MKKLQVIAGLVIGASLSNGLAAEDLIQSERPFSSGATVKSETREMFSKTRTIKTEEGELNGVKYRFYYSDGSGTFAAEQGNKVDITESAFENWDTRCIKDAMTDEVACRAFFRDFALLVTQAGDMKIVVGSDHYPGSNVALRIDDGVPMVAPSAAQFSAAQSKQLAESLRNGQTVKLRYQEWPYEANVDKSFTLHGYEEVYAFLQWAVTNAR